MGNDEQQDEAGFMIEAPATSLTLDRDRAILALRLCLAVNALRASHRHYLANDAPGPGGERDRLWAFLPAAAYVKEALNILARGTTPTPQKAEVEALARRSGATDDLVRTIDQLADGTHPLSDFVRRVRNKLTFHWDPDVLGEWIDQYDKPSVMWFDARDGSSNGDTLYRAASDAVSYSMVPPTEAERALPDEEGTAAVAARFTETIVQLTGVMDVIANYFEMAIATHLRDAGAVKKNAPGTAVEADRLRAVRRAVGPNPST